METKNKIKIESNAIKIYIFACGFGLTFYAGLLCFGMRTAWAEFLSMTFAFALLTGAAWAFRLCWLSYCFIMYMYALRCAMILNTQGFFGKWLDIAHWVMFIAGLFLCGFFVGRQCMRQEEDRGNEETAGTDGKNKEGKEGGNDGK